MAKFFNHFSKIYYTLNRSGSLDLVTNIITRFAFEQSLKENTMAFYDYEIQEGDTPEIIAYKYYKNAERHWIVLLFNNIVDPQFDWPLTSNELLLYVDKKYANNGGITWAKSESNPHSYYKVSVRTSDYDGTQLIEKFQITAEDYANTGIFVTNYMLQDGTTVTESISTEIKTHYEYEVEENEKKRKIKLLKPEFIHSVEKEFIQKVK